MNDFLHDIIDRKTSGEILSMEEEEFLSGWLADARHRAEYKELFQLKRLLLAGEVRRKEMNREGFKRLQKEIKRNTFCNSFRYGRFAACAAGILLAGIVTWITLRQPLGKTGDQTEIVQTDPTNKQVVVRMASGEYIVLKDKECGVVKKEAGVTIEQTGNSTLQYNAQAKTDGSTEYNTLCVPHGGKYNLILADGTKVWLNAGTSLTYPVCFTSATREVTLEGEAYFEVSKDKTKPFIVKTAGLNTCVTGTQFNVSAYAGRYEVTLIEGGVDVSTVDRIRKHLNINEQAVLESDGEILVQKADVETVIAWKNGCFKFKKKRLEQIVEDLSRWYDIEVTYLDSSVKDYHFSAQFKRDESIEDVITILEKTGKIKIMKQEKTLYIDKR